MADDNKITLPPSPENLRKYEKDVDELQRILITYCYSHRIKSDQSIGMMSLLTAQLGFALVEMRKTTVDPSAESNYGMRQTFRNDIVRDRALRIMKIAIGDE